MKTFLITLLGFCLAISLPAQEPVDNPPPIRLTAEELDELLGPVALYPDALISLILPASTAPMDIVLAARFIDSDGDLARVEDKPWEPSVIALTRYPETLRWLDENLEWTSQVGAAFIEQPVEVMESIQRLRAIARELGNLVDTPQQRIVMDETYIRIIPAQPDYIYEPRYDPEIIYYERPVSSPLLFFSVGFGVGSWLNYDCDWRRHRVYRGDWHEGWDYHRDSDRRDRGDNIYINNNFKNIQEWRPDPVRHRTQSRNIAERVYNDRNTRDRTQSRDSGTRDARTADQKNGAVESRVPSNDLSGKESRKRHAGIVRPNAIAGAPHHAEGVKRTEQNERVKTDKGVNERARMENESTARRLKEDKPEGGSKGRVAQPGSLAPGMPGDGRNKNEARDGGDRKKSPGETSAVSPRAEPSTKKEGDIKGRAGMSDSKRDEAGSRNDAALKEELRRREDSKRSADSKRPESVRQVPSSGRVEAPKREEPRRIEAPKPQEAQKKPDMPKRPESVRPSPSGRVEAPKREESKRIEAPKPQEAQKKPDMPKRPESVRQAPSGRVEAPKREEPKRVEAPKRQEVQKKPDMPKRPEANRQEAPKRVEAPKREEPKRQEPQKKQEAPKRAEPSRREEPKREQVKTAAPSAPAREKAKAEDKKKEEDKDKKKKR